MVRLLKYAGIFLGALLFGSVLAYAATTLTPDSFITTNPTATNQIRGLLTVTGTSTLATTTVRSVSSGLVGANNGLLYGLASSSLFGYTPEQPLTFNSPLNRIGNAISFLFNTINTWTGLNTFSGGLTSTGVTTLATTTTGSLNNEIVVDGIHYAQTAAGIQSAINVASTLNECVYLPAGYYSLSTSTQLLSNTCLRGAGEYVTFIQGPNLDHGAIRTFQSGTAKNVYSNITLRDFSIHAQTGHVFDLENIDGLTIQNIAASSTSGSVRETLWVQHSQHVFVNHNYFYNTKGDGIQLNDVSYFNVVNNIVDNSADDAIDIDSDFLDTAALPSTYGTVVGNAVNGAVGGEGIRIEDSQDIAVTGNTVQNALYGIEVNQTSHSINVENITVSGNTTRHNLTGGITTVGNASASTSALLIEGNTIEDEGVSSGAGVGGGIVVNASSTQVVGNSIMNGGMHGTTDSGAIVIYKKGDVLVSNNSIASSTYGINVWNGSGTISYQNVEITNNYFGKQVGTNYTGATTQTGVAISGTIFDSTGNNPYFSLKNGFIATASSTIVGNATTTGTFFASIASSTNLFGAGLATCNGNNALTWTSGLFGCSTLTGFDTFAYPFINSATSSALTFSGGLVSNGSTTIASLGSGLAAANNGLLYGAATTSIGANNGLTFSGTAGAQVGGVGGNFGLATINAGVLGAVTNGSTPTSQATSTLFGTGTPGQHLAWLNGVPSWTATTTFSCSSGVTCTFSGNQESYSIANNALTLAMLPTLPAGDIWANNTAATGNALAIATSSIFGTGTGGQVLAWNNGVPQWVGTTTNSCSNGVTCTFSGTTWTFSDPGAAFPFTPTTYNAIAVNSTTTPLYVTSAASGFGLIASSTFATYASSTQATIASSFYIDGFGNVTAKDVSTGDIGLLSPHQHLTLQTGTTTTWTATTSGPYIPLTIATFSGTLKFAKCYATSTTATDAFLGTEIDINGAPVTPKYLIASTTLGTTTLTAANTFKTGDRISAKFGTTTTAGTTYSASCTVDAVQTS